MYGSFITKYNAVERWLRVFNSEFDEANHVTVRKFIDMIKQEYGLQEAENNLTTIYSWSPGGHRYKKGDYLKI